MEEVRKFVSGIEQAFPEGLQTEIRKTHPAGDRQIEKLVYDLYNLSEEDISIVEGSYLLSQALTGQSEEELAGAAL